MGCGSASGTSPETVVYTPAPGDDGVGTYTVRVCDFADTFAWDEPRDYSGQSVIVEPMTVPNIGRFGILQDPQGAVFGIIKGEPAS